MDNLLGDNLRRIMSQLGLTINEVAERTKLDKRTIRGILEGSKRPHPKTIGQLAEGLGVSVDELYIDPTRLLYRRLDKQTNPVVEKVIQEYPELFADWTTAEFEELYSRFGMGGAMTEEGVLEAARKTNRRRILQHKLAVLLETSQAELI
ncbi:MAG TPA: helix-turn-helix transcriptional regulator, partial [Thermogutta sp.]|nr:helix-turn-helix transcriptional regulator [Thermogutta sp.]